MSKMDCVIQTKNIPIPTLIRLYEVLLEGRRRITLLKANTALSTEAITALNEDHQNISFEIRRLGRILRARGLIK